MVVYVLNYDAIVVFILYDGTIVMYDDTIVVSTTRWYCSCVYTI